MCIGAAHSYPAEQGGMQRLTSLILSIFAVVKEGLFARREEYVCGVKRRSTRKSVDGSDG